MSESLAPPPVTITSPKPSRASRAAWWLLLSIFTAPLAGFLIWASAMLIPSIFFISYLSHFYERNDRYQVSIQCIWRNGFEGNPPRSARLSFETLSDEHPVEYTAFTINPSSLRCGGGTAWNPKGPYIDAFTPEYLLERLQAADVSITPGDTARMNALHALVLEIFDQGASAMPESSEFAFSEFYDERPQPDDQPLYPFFGPGNAISLDVAFALPALLLTFLATLCLLNFAILRLIRWTCSTLKQRKHVPS